MIYNHPIRLGFKVENVNNLYETKKSCSSQEICLIKDKYGNIFFQLNDVPVDGK